MPADRIAELRRLLAEGTQGEWKWEDDALWGAPPVLPEGANPFGEDVEGEWADANDDRFIPTRKKIIETDSGYYPPREADRALIVAAVNSLPLLLDAVEAARRASLFPHPDEPFRDGDPQKELRDALARLAGGR